MSIRPLDMQVMIPKTSELSAKKNMEYHKQNAQQFQLEVNKQKMDHIKQQQVSTMENGSKIDKDGKGNGNSNQNKKNKKRKQKQSKNNKQQVVVNGHIDIRI